MKKIHHRFPAFLQNLYKECSENEVKVDRTPNNTHWGRIDPRTGADQRAEVGLLTRNVRFFGEMSSATCQYAKTRESLATDSPNNGKNFCAYYAEINGFDQDLHGAHVVATKVSLNIVTAE